MKKGFTLMEILIAILIVGVLVAMAAPMYEKAIEKSRIADVRVKLKRLYEAKMRVMDNMESETYSPALFGLENLDYAFDCEGTSVFQNDHRMSCNTSDFKYVINPTGSGNENAVCAVRLQGDYQGVAFLFREDTGAGQADRLLCNDSNSPDGKCEVYGMDSTGDAPWCTL